MRAFANRLTRTALAALVVCALVAAAVPLVPLWAQGANHEDKRTPTKTTAKKKVPAKKPAERQKPETSPARTPFSAADAELAIVPGIPDARAWGDSEREFGRLLPQAAGPWLALSGGGADGAYGAGLIVGWTQSGQRPEFTAVTGVSTGAVIAPFAFLGPRYDEELRKNFTTITAADVFSIGGVDEALFDTWPLKRLIERRVTRELIADIAAEHGRGRRLLVVTTNLDTGRPHVWNMGAIAAHGGDKALKLFHQILLASSSIPGLFPPVYIDVEANGRQFQEMHADGTINAPFYLAPNSMLSPGASVRLPATDIYVIVNGKLTPDFLMPERERSLILSRALGVALQFGLRAQILQTYAAAARLNIGYHLAFVNPDFSFPSRGAFDPDYMKALFDVAAEAGKNGTAFRTRPPDLP
jgi:predicted acylesterase/phospholipase RssA